MKFLSDDRKKIKKTKKARKTYCNVKKKKSSWDADDVFK